MVYNRAARALDSLHFEVDSTESVWYKNFEIHCLHCLILKLTPQSQYGIWCLRVSVGRCLF